MVNSDVDSEQNTGPILPTYLQPQLTKSRRRRDSHTISRTNSGLPAVVTNVRVKREWRCQQEIEKTKEQKKKVFGVVVVGWFDWMRLGI
jgi:hypothetical protein